MAKEIYYCKKEVVDLIECWRKIALVIKCVLLL